MKIIINANPNIALEMVAIIHDVPHDIVNPVTNIGSTRYVYAPEMFGKQFIIEQINAALNTYSGVETMVITSNNNIAVNYTGDLVGQKKIDINDAKINIGGQQCGYTEDGGVSSGWPFGIYDPDW